jgi:hypothetical protein
MATPDGNIGATDLGERLAAEKKAYAGDEDRPLEGYVAAIATYGAFAALLVMAAASRRKDAPDRFALTDIALTGVATHKLTRIISKDSVTSPLRAPFTRYSEPGGAAEVNEEVRDQGSGLRHSIGELITCPFCLAVWVATGLTGGLVLAPRLTRLTATALTATAVSDFLQMAYSMAKEAAEGDPSPHSVNGRSPAQA